MCSLELHKKILLIFRNYPEKMRPHLRISQLFSDDEEEPAILSKALRASSDSKSLWKSPTRSIMKPTLEALLQYKMITDGDRVLVCVSGGKDSLTLLHTLRQYQQQAHRHGIQFQLGAITVDPGSASYDPSPLIPYMQALDIPYFYEKQCKLSSVT